MSDSTWGIAKARKDKGRPRFTAYMLWAKANREKVVKEIGAAANNFAVVSKRLVSALSSFFCFDGTH